MDFIQTVLDALALMVSLVMAYFAITVLLTMRSRLLESSWQNIAKGAIAIAAGVVIFSIPPSSAVMASIISYAGTSCQVIGGFLMILGFRSQHPKMMVRKMEKNERKTGAPHEI